MIQILSVRQTGGNVNQSWYIEYLQGGLVNQQIPSCVVSLTGYTPSRNTI